MMTDKKENYDQNERIFTEDSQSYVEQYQKDHLSEQQTQDEDLRASEDLSYLDNEFSNALERDDEEDLEQDYEQDDLEEEDLEQDYEENDLEEEDLDDDLVEDYDENDREPETFADDGEKID